MIKFTIKIGLLPGLVVVWLMSNQVPAQPADEETVLSGARFTNGLFEKWIDEYQILYPGRKFRIEDKGAAEFSNADLIVHGRRLSKSETDKDREYITIAKYAILIVSNENSPFADYYGKKGINTDQIKQVFFFDPIENVDKQELKVPYNVYTRLQLAPSPIVFASSFGYGQQQIHGRAIAGTDLHLIMAVLSDSLGITYIPLPLVYSPETGMINAGLKVIPVDVDGNGRVSDDEHFYDSISSVLEKLSARRPDNIPVAEVQVSILRKGARPEAVQFLTWILDGGQKSLARFGYLNPDPKILENQLLKLAQLALDQP
ncbi:MAG: hypothetical protein KFF73_01420 [Cyclobacteriaceae bacterium]|nr:hypothetical protein [Cyclobacteriaceae bacterium]